MTFDSLQVQLRAYLERGTVSDVGVFEQLPNLINQAERAIANQFKILGFFRAVTATLQAGLSVYDKPGSWRQTISMNYGLGGVNDLKTISGNLLTTDDGDNLVLAPVGGSKRTPIYARSLEYCQAHWPDQTKRGQPRFYAEYDYYHWLIVPTPDLAYPWAINYYQLLPLLGPTNQANWLTDIQPNMLLYRALLECTPFLKNDERIQVWQGMYDKEANGISVQDLQKTVDRASVRNTA
jgi:hypothetical protein